MYVPLSAYPGMLCAYLATRLSIMTIHGERLRSWLDTRRMAIAAGTGAVLTWGLAPAFAKWIPLDGLSLAFYRLWLGAPSLKTSVAIVAPCLHGDQDARRKDEFR